jgi:hypothetical protein
MTLDNNYKYFFDLGIIDLGSLNNLYDFLENITKNIYKVRRANIREILALDKNLNNGDYMTMTKYGPGASAQYIFTGENLIKLFDDWQHIQDQVEMRSGTKVTDMCPRIIFIEGHVYRHSDKRHGAINVGLWNCDTGATLFWENRKLISYFNMDIGQAILMNTEVMHSVTLDDSRHYMDPRAVLTWDISDPYTDIINDKLRN